VKYQKILFAVMFFALIWSACSQKTLKTSDLESEQDKISYSVGYNMGLNLAGQKAQFNQEALTQGIKDALSASEPLLDQNQIKAALETFQEIQTGRFSEDRAVQAETNRTEGPAFLAANKEKDNVITKPSGLQYTVLREGTGPRPQLTDSVSVHYLGTFIDESEFNNSYTAGNPAIFTVNQVIPGWTEALQMMKVGGKWRIWLPSELGYGEAGAGTLIGPHAVLVFEVELLSILD
jgi:FKBP-type peptidyl-prolyl cis-trans isomerase FklB